MAAAADPIHPAATSAWRAAGRHAASRSLPTGAARYRTGVAGRTEPELVVVDDPAEEARRLFLDVAPRTFVLSGGRTPEDFYRLLAATDHAWSGVEVFFGDERCVPEDDE